MSIDQLCPFCNRPVITRAEGNGVKVRTDHGNWHVHVEHKGRDIIGLSASSQKNTQNTEVDRLVQKLFEAATHEISDIRERWDE